LREGGAQQQAKPVIGFLGNAQILSLRVAWSNDDEREEAQCWTSLSLFVLSDQLDDSFADFGDHPARCHRHHPAGLGTACLQAIEVRLRPVAMLVVLDAELGDLSVDGGCDLLLRPLDLGAPLRRRAVLAVQVIATGFSGLRLLRQSQQHMTEEFIDV
jgi:hypothetical protein